MLAHHDLQPETLLQHPPMHWRRTCRTVLTTCCSLQTSQAPCRPLVLGKRSSRHGDEWCVASEDCAFGPIGFKRVRDVLPGEMIIIDEEGQLMSRCWPAC